jgi:hypothetical protein
MAGLIINAEQRGVRERASCEFGLGLIVEIEGAQMVVLEKSRSRQAVGIGRGCTGRIDRRDRATDVVVTKVLPDGPDIVEMMLGQIADLSHFAAHMVDIRHAGIVTD